MGNHPCVFTEIGIPYDMDDKYAYKTGDYSSQVAAMDANHFALEASGVNGYSLWVYMANVSTGTSRAHALSLNSCRIITSGATSGTERTSPSSPLTTQFFPSHFLQLQMGRNQQTHPHSPLIELRRTSLKARQGSRFPSPHQT